MNKHKIQFYFYMFLILFFSSIPNESMPKTVGLIWDKLLHVVEYTILGFLGFRAFRYRKKSLEMSLIFFGIFFGCLDESWQSFIPGRTPSINDVIADGIGVTIGVVLGSIYNKTKLS